ncbi:MAG: hypothetical protein HQL95_12955 [Magnetococcales bacterium]|nr:hypothetical protein [Magnetococcales bacterium]
MGSKPVARASTGNCEAIPTGCRKAVPLGEGVPKVNIPKWERSKGKSKGKTLGEESHSPPPFFKSLFSKNDIETMECDIR